MGFSLEVQTKARPDDVASVWANALALRGMKVEFPPGFSMETCSGVLIVKVLSAPANLVRVDLAEPVAAYFEVWIDEEGYGFSTASGRTTVDFAVQCLCAAALAEHTDGVYVDPQMGESAQGAGAYRLAMEEIEYFIGLPDEPVNRKFIDWETLDA
jgi:hypothetical protein